MAFEFLKRQFRKVIQWENADPQTIVWQYPLDRKEEIMRKSQLVVREGQKALFIQEGKLADVFGPGTYELSDIRNIPLLTALYNWKFAWESPYTGDVYFISTRQFINNKWGTSNPIMMRDKEFGMVRVRGFGTYSFAVGTPTAAMNELFGALQTLSVRNVDEYFRKILVSVLSESIAELQVPALDLAMNYSEISQLASRKAAESFEKIGIELKELVVENLSLPPEVEKMMDKRTQIGVLDGSMHSYAQMESVGAMRDAAKNPGGMANMGVGLGAGVGIGRMFASNMNDAMQEPTASAVCPHCGAQVKQGAKFCPDCGKSMQADGKVCPKCGTGVKANAKFCPNCGQNLADRVCSKCGHKCAAGAKFCPECGQSL